MLTTIYDNKFKLLPADNMQVLYNIRVWAILTGYEKLHVFLLVLSLKPGCHTTKLMINDEMYVCLAYFYPVKKVDNFKQKSRLQLQAVVIYGTNFQWAMIY